MTTTSIPRPEYPRRTRWIWYRNVVFGKRNRARLHARERLRNGPFLLRTAYKGLAFRSYSQMLLER